MQDKDRFAENFYALLEAKRSTKSYLDEKDDEWSFDDEGVDKFDYFFRVLLNGRKLEDVVAALKKSRGEVHAANLFGGTKALEDLGVDEGCAVRLKKQRQPNEGFEVIEGSLLDKKTWAKIPADLDLIISMPRGALYHLPDSPDFCYFLMNSAWQKMKAEGSVALFQVPRWLSDVFVEWAKVMEDKGIHLSYTLTELDDTDKDTYFAVMLVRDANSPQALPAIGESQAN